MASAEGSTTTLTSTTTAAAETTTTTTTTTTTMTATRASAPTAAVTIPDAFWDAFLWVPQPVSDAIKHEAEPKGLDNTPDETKVGLPTPPAEEFNESEKEVGASGDKDAAKPEGDDASKPKDEKDGDDKPKDAAADDNTKDASKGDAKEKKDGEKEAKEEEETEEVPTFRFTNAVLGELNDILSLAFAKADGWTVPPTETSTPSDTTATTPTDSTTTTDTDATTKTTVAEKAKVEDSASSATAKPQEEETPKRTSASQAVVLKCPQAQGAFVIDQVLRLEAERLGAEVLVLDALELSKGRFGALGEAGRVIDELYASRKYLSDDERSAAEEEAKKTDGARRERVRAFFDALLFGGPSSSSSTSTATATEELKTTTADATAPSPEANAETPAVSKDASQQEVTAAPADSTTTTAAAGQALLKRPRKRIVYIRDFHRISTVAKPLMTYILDALERYEGMKPADVEQEEKEAAGAAKKKKEEEEAAEKKKKEEEEEEAKKKKKKKEEEEKTKEGGGDGEKKEGESIPTPPESVSGEDGEGKKEGEVKEGVDEEKKAEGDEVKVDGGNEDEAKVDTPSTEQSPKDATPEAAPTETTKVAEGTSEETKPTSELESSTSTEHVDESSTTTPTPSPKRPALEQSTVVVFGTNSTIDSIGSSVERESKENCLFLNSLFLQVRSEWAWKYMPSSCKCSVCSPSQDPSPAITLEKIRSHKTMGERFDAFWAKRLNARVFAANLKYEKKDAKWQEKVKSERFKAINGVLFKAMLARNGCRVGDIPLDAAMLNEMEPNSILDIHDVDLAMEIVAATALDGAGTEAGKSAAEALRARIDSVYKNIRQAKKERALWESGEDPSLAKDENEKKEDDEEEKAKQKRKEEEDAIFSSVSSHAQELRGCLVSIDDISTTFSDVFVDKSTVESLQTIVSLPLLFPQYFNSGVLAKEAIGGILLYGPPGTGKTMLCRALAKTCHARMLHLQPSDINDKWVGESEKKVAAVFELAHKLAPCIIFIDEIDSLFSARNSCTRTWERNILTEFMTGMDGLKSAKKNRDNRVVVVGATNRPFDLDLAVLRRLPRRIMVDMPTLEMRSGILKSYFKDETLAPDVNIEKLALETSGFSGSDLKNLCVAAALASVKDAIGTEWQNRELPKLDEKVDLTKNEEMPVRKISLANIQKARSEIVKSVTGNRGDELYKWHQQHSGRGR